MAVTPQTLIDVNDQFLLNRGGATFKTPFENLAENVLNLVVDGDNNGENSLIILNDIGDVDTSKFVKQRDPITGEPTLIGQIGPQADGTVVSKSSAFWLLQHVDSSVPGDNLTSDPTDGQVEVKSEFVLADPKNLFRELAGEIDDSILNLELNSLRDVTTRLGVEPGSAFAPHVVNDTFLVCVSEGISTGDPETEVLPEYQPRRLSRIVSDLIDNKDVEIDLETIVDVNPIFNLNITPGNPSGDLETVNIRLEVNEDYKNGVPNAQKYTPVLEAKNDDDILVYITKNSVIVDQTVVPAFGLVDSDKTSVKELPAGWYYAENVSDGTGKLEPAELANDALEAVDQNIKLGGVRVATYKNTVLVDDPALGGKKVQSIGTVPSNIGITDDGILYSEIPKTLSFVQAIDITPDGNQFFHYVNDISLVNVGVPEAGPLDATNGEPTNNTDAAVNGPNVGDFYVIRMVEGLDGSGDPANNTPAVETSNVEWNTIASADSGIDGNGNTLIVKNGDLVAFGGSYWAVIGTVNTDTVAQDLQNVTTVGNRTTRGIKVSSFEGNGLSVGAVVNYENANSVELDVPGGGVAMMTSLQTNNINFDYIRDLSEAGEPIFSDGTLVPGDPR